MLLDKHQWMPVSFHIDLPRSEWEQRFSHGLGASHYFKPGTMSSSQFGMPLGFVF